MSNLLEGCPLVDAVWKLAGYPDSEQLKQLARNKGQCLLFLDFRERAKASAIALEVDSSCHSVQIVGLQTGQGAEMLSHLMRLGIREVVDLPISGAEMFHLLYRIGDANNSNSASTEALGDIFAFIPAKAGVGASTLAVHCAGAVARLSSRRTLLTDFDFRLGMTSFLLRLDADHSVIDALSSDQMEEGLWERMVNRRGSLDILGSAPIDFQGDDPERGTTGLLEFARRIYSTICVDLPGEMRAYELDTMHRAKECFLVCTGDIAALHMAKRTADFLRANKFGEKTSVILNRADSRGQIPVKDIAAILRLPVRFQVPNAQREIAQATQMAAVLVGRSPVVQQIENIARRLLPAGSGSHARPLGKKFIEFFSLTPARELTRRS